MTQQTHFRTLALSILANAADADPKTAALLGLTADMDCWSVDEIDYDPDGADTRSVSLLCINADCTVAVHVQPFDAHAPAQRPELDEYYLAITDENYGDVRHVCRHAGVFEVTYEEEPEAAAPAA